MMARRLVFVCIDTVFVVVVVVFIASSCLSRSSSVSSSSSSPTSAPPPSEGAPSSCRRHRHFRHIRPSLSSVQVALSSSPSSCLRLSFVIVLFAIRTAIARHTFVEHRCTMSRASQWGCTGDPGGIQCKNGGSGVHAVCRTWDLVGIRC